jgi:hypothetical protein
MPLNDFPSSSAFAVTDSKFLSPRFLTELAHSGEFYAVLNIIFFEQSLFENSGLKNKLHILYLSQYYEIFQKSFKDPAYSVEKNAIPGTGAKRRHIL